MCLLFLPEHQQELRLELMMDRNIYKHVKRHDNTLCMAGFLIDLKLDVQLQSLAVVVQNSEFVFIRV